MGFDLSTAKPAGGFDLSTAMPVDHAAAPQEDDSGFLKGIKDALNETVRVGVKTITGLPLMAGDFMTGLKNAGSKLTGGSGGSPYPSDIYNQQLDEAFAPPTNTAGKSSEALSTLAASLFAPGPKTLPPTQLKAADAIKAATLAESNKAGYVVPPSLTNSSRFGLPKLAEGLGGKQQAMLEAVDSNQPVTNTLASQAIGLNPDAGITRDSLAAVRQEAAAKGYAPLRAIGDIPADAAHKEMLSGLSTNQRGAASIDPRLGDADITSLAEALDKPSFDSGALVDAISAIRAKASDAYSSGKTTLGKAYKAAANGLESLIDRHLQAQGDTDSLASFREARTQIAKTYNIEKALNDTTGNVSATKLAQQLRSGSLPASGDQNLVTAARFGQAFPKAARESAGEAPAISPIDLYGSAASAAHTGGASLAIPVSRVGMRAYALSKAAQAKLQPATKTLSPKALDAVFANPTAYAALYEDAEHH